MSDDDRVVLGSRRGWSFGRRVRAQDSYGLLLLLILLSLVASALNVTALGRLGVVTRVVMLGGTLVFALYRQ